jgi:hypothetical protein
MKDRRTPAELDGVRQIYGTTRGYCHCCRRKLAFVGYAQSTGRGAWDIDARALRPACCACLSCPMGPAPKVRRAPVLAAVEALSVPAVVGHGLRHTLLGGLLGAFVLGPWGALLGGLLGAEIDGGDVRRA